MEYRVLGPLEVERDGELVDLGAHRQRTLLAVLLSRANNVVSMDDIIEALWGADGGPDRQNALWVYISGLRKVLEPEREKRTDGTVLLTRSPGYVLVAEGEAVDAAHFETLLTEGKALTESDPAAASLVLGEALALWRGKPYEEFTYDSFFQNEIARLEDLRLEAVEARVDADLARGMSRELVSELESLARQHPLRERLSGQLMLALYRSGRQAEALRAYQALKDRLGDELGIEPSPSIRKLEERIVIADPGLDTISAAGVAGTEAEPGLSVRGYELREQIGEGAFGIAYRAYQPAVGREVAIKVIRPELADDPAFIRRFEAEAQLVARLEHPHIVPLYDYWREPGAAYLVMRLMKGGSLHDVLESSALSSHQAVRVADQVASALHTAHEHHVVHRDIKPSNILIDDEGNAYLSDFGIAVGPDGVDSPGPTISGTLAAPYASPEQLETGDVSPSSDIYSLGVVLAQAMTGLRGDVDQIRGALNSGVAPVIDKATNPVSAHRYQNTEAFINDFRRSFTDIEPSDESAAPRTEADNPYKGLRSFESSDATEFFGRERLIDRLVYRLSEPGAKGRFVALVGPSGSGKSSAIKAGLLPALAKGALPTSREWFSAQMVPAPYPFEELESALLSVAVDPPLLLLEQLTSGPSGLRNAIDRILPTEDAQLVLVIDQFEELFTQVDQETADRFLETLVEAVKASKSRLRVVVTLRADFYDRPLRHRAVGELLRDGTEVITPMSSDELERTISGPAERAGVVFEPALVARLIHDVADRPSVLPLLQYTLTELFEARSTSRITGTAYDELGGVSGALVKRAEGILTGLSDSGQEAARLILLRLVTLGEGSEDTRRRVLRTELDGLPVAPGDVDAVLNTFGRHRLFSFDRDPVTRGPSVEIAHETMLTEWGRLRDWIDSARRDVRNQRRLAEAMEEWVAAGRDDAYLLRGGRLEQLTGWAALSSLPLATDEQAFLDASVAERDRASEVEEEQEQRAVDAESRAKHRAQQLTVAGVAGVLVALLAVFGFVQWRSAEDGRTEAESARADAEAAQSDAETARAATELAKEDSDRLVGAAEFVTASGAVLEDDPELAMLYAIAAVKETAGLGYATEEAVDAIHWAMQRQGLQYDVGQGAPSTTRSGPTGLAGVFLLPPAELVEMAEASTNRQLTVDECTAALSAECPNRPAVAEDLPLRFGEENYTVALPEFRPGEAAAAGIYAGTRVTIAIGGALDTPPGFRRELSKFTSLTGVRVDIVPTPFDEVAASLATGEVVDLDVAGFFSAPPAWARDQAVNLNLFLDDDRVRSDFGDYLVDQATFEDESGVDELLGVPSNSQPKGLVFYAKPAWDAAGYEIPATWDELMTLSQQMVDDGVTPWCFQWEAGFASGFKGSDFLESLVLRVGGSDAYDAWVSGDAGFASPPVLEAGQLGNDLIFAPGFVRSGPASISRQEWSTQLTRLLETDPFSGLTGPQCMMAIGAAQQLPLLGPDTEFGPGGMPGVDVDFFPLPPVDPSGPNYTVGGTAYMTALTDRPEVRTLMRYIASEDWGRFWAGTEQSDTDLFISPNRRFDKNAYRGIPTDWRFETFVYNTDRDPADTALRVRLHELTRTALDADAWRNDASDAMPPEIGTWTSDFETGAFWQGMVDWVDSKKPIEEILADIDDQWAALEADGG